MRGLGGCKPVRVGLPKALITHITPLCAPVLLMMPWGLMFTLLDLVFIWSHYPSMLRFLISGIEIFILYHCVLEVYRLFIMMMVFVCFESLNLIFKQCWNC